MCDDESVCIKNLHSVRPKTTTSCNGPFREIKTSIHESITRKKHQQPSHPRQNVIEWTTSACYTSMAFRFPRSLEPIPSRLSLITDARKISPFIISDYFLIPGKWQHWSNQNQVIKVVDLWCFYHYWLTDGQQRLVKIILVTYPILQHCSTRHHRLSIIHTSFIAPT